MKKKFVAVVLLFTFFVSPVHQAFAMTEEELLAHLEDLTIMLANIGRAISTSPELTEAESAALMTQIVAISGEIISIKALYSPIPQSALEQYVEEDNARATVADAELEMLTVRYDSLTKTATATIEFSTTTKRRVFSPAAPDGVPYSSEIDMATKLVLDSISGEFNIRRGDMAQMLRFSSYDPARAGAIAKNSDQASKMAEEFGKRSIVTRISVYPGVDKGRIEFYSDQKETLRLSLTRRADATYKYNIDYFIHDMSDPSKFPTDYEGNIVPPEPILEMLAEDITDDEVEEVTMAITSGIPFASSISNFDRKLVKFMTNNNILYKHDIYMQLPTDRSTISCYYESDRTALSEFLVFIIEGVEAHYEPNVVSSAKYFVPTMGEEYYFGASCENKKRFF